MAHEPVPATLVSGLHDILEGVAGAFEIHDGYLHFICPCGCGEFINIPVATGEKQVGSWKWNGSTTKPTIEPSILRKAGCGFHGFLTDGVWIFT